MEPWNASKYMLLLRACVRAIFLANAKCAEPSTDTNVTSRPKPKYL